MRSQARDSASGTKYTLVRARSQAADSGSCKVAHHGNTVFPQFFLAHVPLSTVELNAQPAICLLNEHLSGTFPLALRCLATDSTNANRFRGTRGSMTTRKGQAVLIYVSYWGSIGHPAEWSPRGYLSLPRRITYCTRIRGSSRILSGFLFLMALVLTGTIAIINSASEAVLCPESSVTVELPQPTRVGLVGGARLLVLCYSH